MWCQWASCHLEKAAVSDNVSVPVDGCVTSANVHKLHLIERQNSLALRKAFPVSPHYDKDALEEEKKLETENRKIPFYKSITREEGWQTPWESQETLSLFEEEGGKCLQAWRRRQQTGNICATGSYLL